MTTASILTGSDRSLFSSAAEASRSLTTPSFLGAYNGKNRSFKTEGFKTPNFAQMRAALPDMPRTEPLARIAAGIALRATLAAIPFATLGWMFFAR